MKTVPGEMNIDKLTYNNQDTGLAKALIERGHQCDIMCCADRKPCKKNIPVGNGEKITLYYVASLNILKNGIMKGTEHIFEKYDILRPSEYNQIFSWYMAKKYPDKVVVYHGPYYCTFNRRYNAMAKVFDLLFLKSYIKLDICFLAKSRLAENYLRAKGIHNVTTVGVGIDKSVLSVQNSEKLDFIDEIQANKDAKIMYIGKLEPRRNVFFLLDVLKKMNEDGSVSMVLVGNGDRKYVNDFFAAAKKMGIYGKILYRKSVEQKYMEQLYGCAKVFLLPTLYDIYGMVLLEAMYFHQVVITTVNGGSDTMIEDGVNGYVVEQFDAARWSDLAWEILRKDDLRQFISEKASRTVREHYTWQALADTFLTAFEEKKQGHRKGR